MNPYLGIVLLALASVLFLVMMLALFMLLGPQHKTRTKQLPFECGGMSSGSAHGQRFHVRFYLVAVLFILFDIEVVFLFPWALILRELGWYGFGQMLVFIAVIAAGLLYIWRRGVLDWNS